MEHEVPKRLIFMPTLLSTIMVQHILDFAVREAKAGLSLQRSRDQGRENAVLRCLSNNDIVKGTKGKRKARR
jgi:hypothetical protein